MKTLLKKDATHSEIELYFKKIFEMIETGEEFPVDLDNVWALAYTRKSDSVEILKKDFVEDIDFQCLRQNPQSNAFENQNFTKAGGDRRTIKYKLSVPCLEWFIARKVKPVFEVYRKVFHATVKLHRQLVWHGQPTIYSGGKVWVNYRSVLRSLGLSTRSGQVAARKRTHAGEFEKFFNQNFVTAVFAETLKKQTAVRQARIEFFKEISAFLQK